MTAAHERRHGEPSSARRTAAKGAARAGSVASRAVLRLQAGAGNAAVSRLLSPVQRRDPGGACPAPAVAPSPPAPKQDPSFTKVLGQVGAAKKATAAHPPANSQAKAAQDAAKPPADDKEAQAKAAQADHMQAAKPAGFDKAAFIAAVNQAIAAQTPKSLEEADKFATSGKADAIKSEVMGKVSKGKDDSARPLADTAGASPDTSKAVEKPVRPLPAAKTDAAPPTVDAAAAMPAKAPAEQTELGAPACETDSKMAQAGVSEQQLAASNEPEFQGALAAKKEGEAHSAAAPGQVRQAEAAHQATAQAGAQGSGQAATAAMAGARGHALAGVAGHQGTTRTADETKRAQVSANVKAIFDRTKVDVDTILGELDGKVSAEFTAGEADAKAAFTREHQTRMDAYKDDRYSGVLGWGRWLKDKILSPPAEVNQIYAQARKVYETRMQAVIGRVADLVGAELTRAKARVAAGKAEIEKYVGGLPKDLQSVGKSAATEIGDQFDTLESSVDEKGQALAEDLASKYVEARTAVDEEIKATQEANKGLWDKAKDAVGGAIETILKLKDMLLGVLARAAGAVEKIIKDPIGFLGNFVSAVKTGVMNFGSNILEHLKEGLKGWLFGALAEAGIEIPETFDLKGIIKLILSLLGLTWNTIRTRILKVIPEPVMALLEKGVDFIQAIMSEGVVGLWKWIAGKMGDLKELVLGKMQDFVVTKVITAGITWLISLLNPAAAFIKACKMIYDAVMWFVDNAARLKEFVDSILDSVESIASGGVGAVAGYIEKTLAQAVPMVISGLASLLGLGGIADKIKSILETVQKPVMKVVDQLIGTAVKYGKSLMKKGGRKKKKDVGEASGAVPVVLRKPFRAGGKAHTITLTSTAGGGSEIVIASTPTSPSGVVALTQQAERRALVDVNQVSADTAAIMSRSARLTEMARQAKLRAGRQDPGVRTALDGLAAVIAACWERIGFDGEHVDRVRRRKDEAGQVGDVGAHKGEQGVRGQASPAGLPAGLTDLESEHVLPWSWIDVVFSRMFSAGSLPGQAQSRVYPKMTTVMTYKAGASGKTNRALQNSDMALWRFLQRIPARDARRVLRDQLPELVRSRMQIILDETEKFVEKVHRDHGVTLAKRPDAATIRQALAAQLAEVFSAVRELR